MENLLHRPIVPPSKLSHDLNLVHVDLEAHTVVKVDSLRMQHRLGELERSRRVPVVSAGRLHHCPATHMILPKSVNLLSSAFGAPCIPLNVNPPGGPLRPPSVGAPGRLSRPGVLPGVGPSDGRGGPPANPLRAARPNGPALGPCCFCPPPRACDRSKAPIDAASGEGLPPRLGDGAGPPRAAAACMSANHQLTSPSSPSSTHLKLRLQTGRYSALHLLLLLRTSHTHRTPHTHRSRHSHPRRR